MKKIIVLGLFCLGIWQILSRPGHIDHPPGILAPNAPRQIPINNPSSFQFKQYTITPLAKFQITSRVLSRKDYVLSRSELSPMDLAMGWGKMSDSSILEYIEISQSGRWYHMKIPNYPIPRREIETHSANMHIIPKNPEIKKQLKKTRIGELVELSGYLVKVVDDRGWTWKSSLTREDIGNGACELIFVESINFISP